MNSLYLVYDIVKLKKDIFFSGLKKGDKGEVIDYEDLVSSDIIGDNKLMNRIECMVEFKVYSDKYKKKIKILEPFTWDEARIYLEHATDEDEFFE